MNHHIRGKSDTEFVSDKQYVDNIHHNIKHLRDTSSFSYKQNQSDNPNNFVSDFSRAKKHQRRPVRPSNSSEITSMESLEEAFFNFLIKLFNFKKNFDRSVFAYVSRKKHYINALLQIIQADIANFKAKELSMENAEEAELILRLDKFLQIIDEIEKIKPEEFYRELKTMLFNEFEQSQSDIMDYLDSIQQTKKSEVIMAVSHSIVFIQSKISYFLDYYSLTMNSLLDSLFAFFVAFIDGNSKDSSNKISPLNRFKRLKSLHYINHFISLSKIFTQDFYSNDDKINYNETKTVSMNNFSSFGRYILNNYRQITSQCQMFTITNVKDDTSLFTKINRHLLYWKDYFCKVRNKEEISSLDQSFRLYFNLRLVVWKNTVLSRYKAKKSNEICRICEKSIPFNEFILHINYCKEQKMLYDKMSSQKKVLKSMIASLTLYRDKLKFNEEKNKNNLFSPALSMLKAIKKLIGFNSKESDSPIYPLISKWTSDHEMISAFILAYAKERDLPLDHYEENPDKCPHIVSLIYFTHLIYQINYFYSIDLTEHNIIFSGLFACLVERLMSTQYILTVQETRMKSNAINRSQSKKSSRNDEELIKTPNELNSNCSSLFSSPKGYSLTNVKHESESFLERANSVSYSNFNQTVDFYKRLNKYKSKINAMSPIISENDRNTSNFSYLAERRNEKHLALNPLVRQPQKKFFSLQMRRNSIHGESPVQKGGQRFTNDSKSSQGDGSNRSSNSNQANDNSSTAQEDLIFDHNHSPTQEKLSFFELAKHCHEESSSPPTLDKEVDSPTMKTVKKSLFSNKSSKQNNFYLQKSNQPKEEDNFNYIKIDHGSDKSSLDSESDDDDDEDSDNDFIKLGIGKSQDIIEIFEELFVYKADKNPFVLEQVKMASPLILNTTKKHITSCCNEEVKDVRKDFSTQTPKISHYQFILKVAEGGYGRVDIYKKISTGDLYAIKTVNISKMKSKNLSATLKNETMILNNINHNLIVKCYYIFKDNVNFYYVMEYMPGGDLFQLLSSIVIPQQTIRFIIAEVILALIYLHSKDIIHKDIKPENILISKDGHFKLTDFGLSESDMRTNTYAILHRGDGFDVLGEDVETREIVGTLNYMAPETFSDDNPSFAVDYWALGVLIYELFTFKAPFSGETPIEVRENIIKGKINWSHLESPETKESYSNIKEAKDLISKFLVKDQTRRWGDRDFCLIKTHPFFYSFYWEEVEEVHDPTVLMHVKKQIEKTNAQIKASKGRKNDTNSTLIPQTDDDDSLFNADFYCERVDNLFSKCQDLIKVKIKQKEFTMMNENDNENYSSIFDDLK